MHAHFQKQGALGLTIQSKGHPLKCVDFEVKVRASKSSDKRTHAPGRVFGMFMSILKFCEKQTFVVMSDSLPGGRHSRPRRPLPRTGHHRHGGPLPCQLQARQVGELIPIGT